MRTPRLIPFTGWTIISPAVGQKSSSRMERQYLRFAELNSRLDQFGIRREGGWLKLLYSSGAETHILPAVYLVIALVSLTGWIHISPTPTYRISDIGRSCYNL